MKTINIPNKIVKQMNVARKQTIKDKNERGFTLYETTEKKIDSGNTCIGDECGVDVTSSPKKGYIKIGHFHTHPPRIDPNPNIMSFADMSESYAEKVKIICIGDPVGIRCFTPTNNINCNSSTPRQIEKNQLHKTSKLFDELEIKYKHKLEPFKDDYDKAYNFLNKTPEMKKNDDDNIKEHGRYFDKCFEKVKIVKTK